VATCLVNPSSELDSFFPIDLAVKFLNRDIKVTWKLRHGSSTDIPKLAKYYTLNGIFFRENDSYL